MEQESEANKISDLIVKFIEFTRIDVRIEITYILTFQLNDKQQKQIKDFKKVRDYCRSKLLDEPFLRKLKRRLAVTETQDSVKYWDKLTDSFDETFNYDQELEVELLNVNVYLIEFIARLLRELEISNLEFKLS
jgi:hypothetical protein